MRARAQAAGGVRAAAVFWVSARIRLHGRARSGLGEPCRFWLLSGPEAERR